MDATQVEIVCFIEALSPWATEKRTFTYSSRSRSLRLEDMGMLPNVSAERLTGALARLKPHARVSPIRIDFGP